MLGKNGRKKGEGLGLEGVLWGIFLGKKRKKGVMMCDWDRGGYSM